MKVERSTVEQVKARFAKKKEELTKKADDSEYDLQDRVKELNEEEQRIKELRREKKREKDVADDAESADANESDFAALMGFSSFGGSKKNG